MKLSRNVYVLGGVSLLTDVASEMAYPLLPVFLTGVLHAGAAALGAIEGTAESVAALLKLASGWWTDRTARRGGGGAAGAGGGRKPLVVIGYGLAAAVKPLIGLASSAGQVAAVRVTDRVGKGIRTSPRDALIADSVAPAIRGRAFGFHRAMDNLGAVLGPLIAFFILRGGPRVDLRQVFLWTAVPGVLSVALLVAGIRETAPGPAPALEAALEPASAALAAARPSRRGATSLGGRFWALLGVLFVFTLANSSDTFLLLRAGEVGVAASLIPVLWALLNLVKALSNVPGGALSDRWGRRPLLVGGWLIYGAVYLGFGLAGQPWQMWLLFAAYGLYFGATEGAEKALVADFVPADRRGTAFGFYNLAIGIGALPASLLFGVVLQAAGPRLAFGLAAALAVAAALAIRFVAPALTDAR